VWKSSRNNYGPCEFDYVNLFSIHSTSREGNCNSASNVMMRTVSYGFNDSHKSQWRHHFPATTRHPYRTYTFKAKNEQGYPFHAVRQTSPKSLALFLSLNHPTTVLFHRDVHDVQSKIDPQVYGKSHLYHPLATALLEATQYEMYQYQALLQWNRPHQKSAELREVDSAYPPCHDLHLQYGKSAKLRIRVWVVR